MFYELYIRFMIWLGAAPPEEYGYRLPDNEAIDKFFRAVVAIGLSLLPFIFLSLVCVLQPATLLNEVLPDEPTRTLVVFLILFLIFTILLGLITWVNYRDVQVSQEFTEKQKRVLIGQLLTKQTVGVFIFTFFTATIIGFDPRKLGWEFILLMGLTVFLPVIYNSASTFKNRISMPRGVNSVIRGRQAIILEVLMIVVIVCIIFIAFW